MTSPDEAAEIDRLWDYSQPAESERRFRERLQETAEGSETRVQVLTQIARAQGLQRKFAEAHATLDDADVADLIVAYAGPARPDLATPRA